MDDQLGPMIGALCALFAVLVALITVYAIRREHRHRNRMQQWADQNGWTLTWHPAVVWGRHLPGGNKHGVSHSYSGVLHNRPVQVAEYSTTDADTNTHHHVITVVRLRRPLPETQVEPRGAASRMWGSLFGRGDTATGNTDFDRAYRIRTTAPDALSHLFSSALITAQLAGQTPPSWRVEGAELLAHQPGRLKPDSVPHHAATMLPLADLLDGYPSP